MLINFKSAGAFSLRLLASAPSSALQARYTLLGCEEGLCFIDRSRSGNCEFNSAFCARATAPTDELEELRVSVVVDVSVVEAFICSRDEHCFSFTERVFSPAGQAHTSFERGESISALQISLPSEKD